MQNVHCVAVPRLPLYTHVLGGCPSTLTQGRYTYRHNQVLGSLITKLSKVLADQCRIFADLLELRARDSHQATIPSSLLITPYHHDIVVHSQRSKSVA